MADSLMVANPNVEVEDVSGTLDIPNQDLLVMPAVDLGVINPEKSAEKEEEVQSWTKEDKQTFRLQQAKRKKWLQAKKQDSQGEEEENHGESNLSRYKSNLTSYNSNLSSYNSNLTRSPNLSSYDYNWQVPQTRQVNLT